MAPEWRRVDRRRKPRSKIMAKLVILAVLLYLTPSAWMPFFGGYEQSYHRAVVRLANQRSQLPYFQCSEPGANLTDGTCFMELMRFSEAGVGHFVGDVVHGARERFYTLPADTNSASGRLWGFK